MISIKKFNKLTSFKYKKELNTFKLKFKETLGEELVYSGLIKVSNNEEDYMNGYVFIQCVDYSKMKIIKSESLFRAEIEQEEEYSIKNVPFQYRKFFDLNILNNNKDDKRNFITKEEKEHLLIELESDDYMKYNNLIVNNYKKRVNEILKRKPHIEKPFSVNIYGGFNNTYWTLLFSSFGEVKHLKDKVLDNDKYLRLNYIQQNFISREYKY